MNGRCFKGERDLPLSLPGGHCAVTVTVAAATYVAGWGGFRVLEACRHFLCLLSAFRLPLDSLPF